MDDVVNDQNVDEDKPRVSPPTASPPPTPPEFPVQVRVVLAIPNARQLNPPGGPPPAQKKFR